MSSRCSSAFRRLASKCALCAAIGASPMNASSRGSASAAIGCPCSIASLIPVSSVISGPSAWPGSTSWENSPVISPLSSFTAPISIILAFPVFSPVLSKSSTTTGPSYGRPSAFSTIGFSSIRYPSHPGISLIFSFFAARKAAGKDCSTPWSVTATAGWPHFAARSISFSTGVSASIVDMLVCIWSSTRFSSAVSSRSSFSVSTRSRTLMLRSLAKLSYRHSPRTRTHMPSLIRSTFSFTAARSSSVIGVASASSFFMKRPR